MKSERGFAVIETVSALTIRRIIEKLRNHLFLILIIITLLSFAFPVQAEARGLAISGTFYRQHFQLLPGETLHSPDVYLVVFNHEDEEIRVKLTTQTPSGVEIMLDQSYFSIPPAEQRKVEVGISISTESVPGEYLLSIAANIQPTEGEGIAIAGAAEQRAKLTIHGKESSLPTNESKDITPIEQAYTCIIYEFSVEPNYHDDTGGITFIDVMYNIEAPFQPLKNANIILSVSFDNELLEQAEIISLPTMEVGSTNGSYRYIPSQGWQNGNYAFKLEVISQDEVLAQSQVEELIGIKPSPVNSVNWNLVGAVVSGLLLIVLVIYKRGGLKKIEQLISALRGPNKKSICFESSEFSGVFNEKTGEIAIAKIAYGIKNQYKPISGVKVELKVRKGTTPFEHIPLVTLNPLEKGLTNLKYDYAPEEGWQKNTAYKFELALYIADKLFAVTPVRARAKSAS